jgi:selenocysteine lyase/cysteine desulfurase
MQAMKLERRGFLSGALAATGTALGLARGRAFAATSAKPAQPAAATPAIAPVAGGDLSSWPAVRDQFLLTRDRINLAMMLLASHPRPVREAIERHRRGFDEDPVTYFHENVEAREHELRESAAAYLGVKPDEIALTGNTTTGLAMLYGGLPLGRGQEIVTTTHDHYATHEALRLRSVHSGAPFRKVTLYATPETVTEGEVVSNLVKAIGPRTRAVAVTWVHSSTGVKLPIRRMADALAGLNQRRDEADRVLLCVDGVHGFGVESETMAELGCDFFVTGCHKWLFGPRGTGLVWGRPDAWKGHAGLIPTFEWGAFEAWMRGQPPDALPPGPRTTPGGFQSFDHRWSLPAAFRFHQQIGRARVTARIHELARRCKQGLAAIPSVRLRTPDADALSSGLVCFEVAGKTPKAVVEHLRARKIVASETPYATSYARFSPSLLNTPEEIDRAVAEIRALVA